MTGIVSEGTAAHLRGAAWGIASLILLVLHPLLFVLLVSFSSDTPDWVDDGVSLAFFATPVCSITAAIMGLFRDYKLLKMLSGIVLFLNMLVLLFWVFCCTIGVAILKLFLPYQ